VAWLQPPVLPSCPSSSLSSSTTHLPGSSGGKGLIRSTGGAVRGNISNIDTLSARRLLLDCRHTDLLVGRGKTTAAVVSDCADQSEREIATNLVETMGLVDATFANLTEQTSYSEDGNSSHST
jgi:hypothetical protein